MNRGNYAPNTPMSVQYCLFSLKMMFSKRKLTLEMTFRAKADVTNATKKEVSILRFARSFQRLQLRVSGLKIHTIIFIL